MGLGDERGGRRKTKTGEDSSHPSNRVPDRKRTSGENIGDALRSAYESMVDEEIPPEMLDLLGKLD